MCEPIDFEPTHPHCWKVWEHLGTEGRRRRLADAKRREEAIFEVTSCVASGTSEREAVSLLVPWAHRSSYRRWKIKYEAYGLDGLLDWRMPLKPPPEMPSEVHDAICRLRREDPDKNVNEIVEYVLKHHEYQTSETTVKRVLNQAGLSRQGGPRTRDSGEQRLELGGMKFVEGADVETGYLEALTEGIVVQLEDALWSEEAFSGSEPEVDTRGRDEFGRLLDTYNERYRKQDGDPIGPGFASVEEKRKGKDARLYHLSGASEEVIERKLIALLVSPLLGSGRWDGIRVPRGDLLGELCGYPYMPSTLELFTRELKYLGVSSTLWEIHARQWLKQTRHWGDERSATVLYIDETNKPVWTELYCESTKVQNVGRVMPGLELASFHTGYGVPLWMVTHSGRAPMVKVVPKLLNQLHGILEGAEVGRLVVIDAEGNSVPFLKGLEQGEPARGFVTRLKPSLMQGKRIFNRTNYRAYRDGDRVRMGECDLNDPDGGTFRVRVVEVERRSSGEITYLGVSKILREEDWTPQELADLYFCRWPNQEANFRAVNQAVGFKDVHGYGKQLVNNISVLTAIDKLDAQIRRLQERMEQSLQKIKDVTAELKEKEKKLQKSRRRYETVSQYVQGRIEEGQRITPKLQRMSTEQQILYKECSNLSAKEEKLRKKKNDEIDRSQKIHDKLDASCEKREKLESRRRIFKHDVELDSLFSLLKVGLVLLIQYVLKEYFSDACMEAVTFLERVATLPARLRLTPELEILTFEYNHRDPDVMALLEQEVETINARRLRMRSGRVLRIKVEPAPPPKRPPPKNRRTMPGDRFRKK